ncbi:1-acyl-sn-glycerol-3-phosphate acyltransferase [Draconibacterium sp. IB214405]|uniref:1-acyl-sn-glycerol-3-phosphate acyltransferase n=1 Tax=Draconibacterium sp. IB214405 TaxID=3097352 RepID=UPI002A11B25D|nr:1-acyl-sn-glycerol-3-phosphate acyltransferase [Draconibacterium sp. IB214405]MDX8338567.1 1-acyl-sn-glycerol-3-phosphate acyltransferase [Draconibacterium sp. IB214405]
MKYEKWSFGYWLFKQYIRFADWIIHDKIILTGEENIPKNKPLLFAPNHQNALSDPLAILLHTRFQPVWLARADIFKPGIITLILRFLKIMPVYRMRDGKDQLAKNEKTFADSIKVLENNFALALFPEAAHSAKRQMLSHKKAVPRIVFQAEEKADGNLDIHIVPTGIYYSSYWKFNRSVLVNFGEPLLVNDFLEAYNENPSAATLKLRDALEKAIEPLTLNIKSKENYESFELIRSIFGNAFAKKSGLQKGFVNRFKTDQQLMKKLDELEISDKDKTNKVCQATTSFETKVRKHGLRSWLVENPENNFWKLGWNKLILLITLPFFAFGFLFNAIPFFIIDTIIRKKIKDFAFWSSFSLVLGFVIFPIVYLLELWAVSAWLPLWWHKLLFFASLPFIGKLAFRWYILLLKTIGRGRLFLLKSFKKEQWEKLKNQQIQLFNELNEIV